MKPTAASGRKIHARFFWKKVAITDGCWEWKGIVNWKGYGRYGDAPCRGAHRMTYEAIYGALDQTLTIDHLCGNTSCVRPDHLEPVTNKVNVLRGVSPAAINARKTHCKNGHPLSGDNIRFVRQTPTHMNRRCLSC